MRTRHGDFTVESSCTGQCCMLNISSNFAARYDYNSSLGSMFLPLLLHLVTRYIMDTLCVINNLPFTIFGVGTPEYQKKGIAWIGCVQGGDTSPCQKLTTLFKNIFRPNINHNCLSNNNTKKSTYSHALQNEVMGWIWALRPQVFLPLSYFKFSWDFVSSTYFSRWKLEV